MSTETFAHSPVATVNTDAIQARHHRFLWVDSARGIGIILVVIGHALNGLISDSRLGSKDIFLTAFQAIYSFHMPLFFFISGIFIIERTSMSGKTFIAQGFRRLMYPYFLWGIIQLIIILLANSLVNHPQPHDWMLFVEIFWHPPSQFWFLYALFIMQMFVYVFARYYTLNAMIAASTVAYLISAIFPLPTLIYFVCHNWIYYSISVLYCSHIKKESFATFNPVYLAIALILWVGLVFFVTRGGIYPTIFDLPAAALGIIITIRIAKLLIIANSSYLRYVGQRSLPIFLQHVIVVAGTRILLTSFLHLTNPFVILAISSILGVLIPCLTYEISKKIGAARMLGFE